jgi:carboxylesterase
MNNTYIVNAQFPGAAFELEGTRDEGFLLYHGFTATAYEVRGLGEVLNRAGYTVSAPMLAGHGTQPGDLNRIRWQDWLRNAKNEYQALAKTCGRVYVGGESTGGLVALYLAATHPEIAGVLAYAPALQLPIKWWQRLQISLIAPFVAGMPKKGIEETTTWQGYKVNPLKGLLQLLALQVEVRRCLPQIHQPLLVVQGKQDGTIDPRSSQIVYDTVSSKVKELHWMDHSGHCVLLDPEQEDVFRFTLEFLEKNRE